MKFSVKYRAKTVELSASKRGNTVLISSVDGEDRPLTAQVISAANGEATIEVDGRQIKIKQHRDGLHTQLWVNGQTVTYERLIQGQEGDGAAGGRLSAEIPAVVSQILVDVGQEVAAGEKLILLESMKMVIPLVAPAAGTVAGIHCVVGEAVQPGVPLIDLTGDSRS